MDREKLKVQLKKHEGVRKYPYEDTVGKVTIGVGRNLTDVGIRGREVDFLLENDIDEALREITQECVWFNDLTSNRQLVIADMVFNLGIAKFLEFKRTIASIRDGKYTIASEQMLESKWARQVGKAPGQRAHTLAKMMRVG